MSGRLHYLQHVPFEDPGRILTWAAQRGWVCTATHLYRGDVLPAVDAFDLLVVMGGPMGVMDEDRFDWLAAEKRFIRKTISAGRKAFGICLGAQLIAEALGAKVYRNHCREIGWFDITFTDAAQDTLLGPPPSPTLPVFHWHGDTFDLPADTVHLARSPACANQAFLYDDRVLALQFHIESGLRHVDALCENCGEELTADAPTIQSPADMRKLTAAHADAAHRLLEQWLDRLCES
jgi:GMP synthase-like glutamine amidotransferase